MKVILSGGTGFLGEALVQEFLSTRDDVVLLSRRPDRASAMYGGRVTAVGWDARTPGSWRGSLEGAEAVINLAGESVGQGRWTRARKERILLSRVEATKAIVAAIAGAKKKPKVLINGSAVGFYGAVEAGDVTEERGAGPDFLAGVCRQWEAEARAAADYGLRVLTLRMGLVLDRNGGALSRMVLPFRFFAGGPLGSGNQWLPWIHRRDVTGIVKFLIAHRELQGPVNAVAPEAVTMREFCRALGTIMHRPSWLRVPGPVIRAMLGEMSTMILTGQKVVPDRLNSAGYAFAFPGLADALAEILS